jgi:formate dehydrogenase major subunit
MEWMRKDNPYQRAYGDPEFPYLLTTYRLTEHHTAGGMSRWLSWLSELQPEMFCEVSPELAAERGLNNGGWATIRTRRAEIEARVLVTQRMRPLRIRGRVIHQIGLPYHWSSKGLVRGDAANDLIAFVADPNVAIQESKVFTGNIAPGRRGRGRRRATGGSPGEDTSAWNWERDLPQVGQNHDGRHGHKTAQSREGKA